MTIAFLIPLLPLLGFVLLLIFGKKLGSPNSGWLATAAVGASFVVSCVVLFSFLSRSAGNPYRVQHFFTWMSVANFHLDVGLLIDPLSLTMVLFVTGVSTLIHLYSIGYMKGDRDFSKFFLYLNLFVASMVILVLSDNFILTFVGWEGVGACSYLLVAFWFERPRAASAGKKAFVVNRIGDFGFLLASFLIFQRLHSLNYKTDFSHLNLLSPTSATVIALLLFLAAVGKSAQFPLFTWLVDAMEGPTPVSALIHAATMVTAGVFLMVRVAPILALSHIALLTIAIVGLATAFIGATSACAQNDIKKVLAYSTVSQLGYMFLAVGSQAYVAAIFLMVAHAFYKALLFLGAGSVIHGLHDEQDIKKMGGLRKWMPATSITFIIGWLAIGGVPPFAGFWAKGDVLLGAFSNSPILWAIGAFTGGLTAYYIGREVYLVFFGEPRWQQLAVKGPFHDSVHESPRIMLIPLYVLAIFSVLGGLLDLPFSKHLGFLGRWLAPLFAGLPQLQRVPVSLEITLGTVDAILAIAGVVVAHLIWSKNWQKPSLEPVFLNQGWKVDSTSDAVVARPGATVARLSSLFDSTFIDGIVNGVGALGVKIGTSIRKLQNGYIRNYAMGIAIGTVLLLAIELLRVTP